MKKNFLFLGFAIPDEEMQKLCKLDHLPPIQTHKFNWNVIKGIEKNGIFNYTYISASPVSDFPFYPHKIVKMGNWNVNIFGKNINIVGIPFVNTSILKIITRFLSAVYNSIKKYHRVANKGGVIVYSVHVPFMLTGLIISRLYKIDYIAIWTDPPSVANKMDSFIKSKLRNIELSISKYLMNKADKVIALTKYLAEDFAPGKPYIIVEGIIDDNDINDNKTMSENKNSDFIKVVYTGSLEKRYGIDNIVEAFILMNNEKVIFEIYGRGDYEEELKEICKINKNIRYKGFVSNEEVLNIQRNADFLINARSPEDKYVKYSFPSKTLEYMISGTPLISTMLPGIPEEYKNYIIVLDNNNPKTICKILEESINLEKEDRKQLGQRALEFAKTKNYINQGKRIVEFIS